MMEAATVHVGLLSGDIKRLIVLGVEERLMAVITGKSSCGRVWNVSTNRFQSELNSGACSPLISPSREKWAGLFGAELFSLSTLIRPFETKSYPCFCPLLHLPRGTDKNLAISIPWSFFFIRLQVWPSNPKIFFTGFLRIRKVSFASFCNICNYLKCFAPT